MPCKADNGVGRVYAAMDELEYVEKLADRLEESLMIGYSRIRSMEFRIIIMSFMFMTP